MASDSKNLGSKMFSTEESKDCSGDFCNEQPKHLPERKTPGKIVTLIKTEKQQSLVNVDTEVWFSS